MMREEELRKHAICDRCKKPIGHTQIPLFWVVKMERFGIKMDAVKRQDALAIILGGSSKLASVMGPDEDMAVPVMKPVTITLCEECALGEINLAVLALSDY